MLSPEIVVEDELFVTVAEFDAFIPGEGFVVDKGEHLLMVGPSSNENDLKKIKINAE